MPSVSKQQPVKKRAAVKKSSTISDKFQPVDFDADEGIKILLYGRSGTGKTTLWSSFPGKILAIVCSGGNKPGELRSLNRESRKKTTMLSVANSTEILEAVQHQKETEEFNTVVLDHVTGLQDRVLAEVLGVDTVPAQKGWGLASQQQYGQCTLQCKDILRDMLSLRCNVVIVGQEMSRGTDSESEIIAPCVGVALSPSLAGWLNPACDYVCQTLIRPRLIEKKIKVAGKVKTQTVRGEGVEYCIRTAPHDVYTTKFRVPKGSPLPEFIVDPDYDKIISVIQGS